MTYEEALKIRKIIERGTVVLDDTEALEVPELFPNWEVGKAYAVGDRMRYGEQLYKCVQAHTSQADWTPDVAVSLYKKVADEEQGDDPSNPIPYDGNMELFNGKYYSQFDVVYICFRDTGIPVYNNLADLVGIYVNVYSE